jgi:hypothetical protein
MGPSTILPETLNEMAEQTVLHILGLNDLEDTGQLYDIFIPFEQAVPTMEVPTEPLSQVFNLFLPALEPAIESGIMESCVLESLYSSVR